jgi:hypothetical protein
MLLTYHISRNLRRIRRFLFSLIEFFLRCGLHNPDKSQRETPRPKDEEAPDAETSGLGECRWELTYYIG